MLEIGTSSGYSTALLAHRVRPDRPVIVEIDPTSPIKLAPPSPEGACALPW
ncbi:hypothetical protein G3I60_20800 [Streptomyces sp. SID13666]|uniref:hypothetical protein n=1 Tax=unclassified Streptomyces TaxID=2593676 RepID=UPI0013C27B9F|nr:MULTISPECIES: hypothetical protein [unclassified Streptomyces]NEA56514.1 hypothetical protein [Streptomyces sp. SID13666]NEA72308.1 hypothetical protein [Streptomyces sp. SID13588]